MFSLTKRDRLLLLRGQLENERSSFIADWRDLGDNLLPRRPRFNTFDTNRGGRRNQRIIDSSPVMAVRTMRAGMMGGITSPARPWFRLSTPDPDLSESAKVKEWCYIVGQRMVAFMAKSNLYNILPITYGDMGVFATAAMSVEENFKSGMRCYSFPIGSYKIANNSDMKVDVFQRDFRLTVRQLIERFGVYDERTGKARWDNFSPYVKSQYDNSNYEVWIDVCHTIEPNMDFDPKKLHSKFKRYASTYFETSFSGTGGTQAGTLSDTGPEIYLQEKGYDNFPILCPRWEVTGEDAYGTSCPGVDAIGDTKQLQVMQKRKAQAVEKKINPPMVGPTSLKTQKTTILPGDITYVDEREGQKGFRSAHDVNIDINEIREDIKDTQQRISRAFYEDLFLMLSESDRRQITAREVDERHEEKLLALGPVLEQLNQDLLDPLIDLTFDIMLKQGQIPQPPDELQGIPLKVEYISIMAQAQKLVGIESVERFANFVGNVVARSPEAADKVDVDQMIEVYGEMTSIAPGIVRSDDQVAEIRQQRQQAQQQQQENQAAAQQAQTAKNLSQADTGGDNALTRLMEQAKAGSLAPEN